MELTLISGKYPIFLHLYYFLLEVLKICKFIDFNDYCNNYILNKELNETNNSFNHILGYRCGMDEFYYYERTEKYRPILKHKEIGCFVVPMVHSAVLINLKNKNSDMLTYVPEKVKQYDGPEDDIIAFAVGAKKNGKNLKIFIY